MQIIEPVFIARHESSEHLQLESRLFIAESDRTVKENPPEMSDFDAGLKALVHLNHGKGRCISSPDSQKSWVEPLACIIPHFFGIDAADPVGHSPAADRCHRSIGELVVQTLDRKSTRLNSSHIPLSRMPSSA